MSLRSHAPVIRLHGLHQLHLPQERGRHQPHRDTGAVIDYVVEELDRGPFPWHLGELVFDFLDRPCEEHDGSRFS